VRDRVVMVKKGEIMENFFMKEECEEKRRKEILFKELDLSRIKESLKNIVLNHRSMLYQN